MYKFIGDEIEPINMLHIKILPSPYAHAKILKLDTTQARSYPGVAAVLTYQDIPGENQIGHPVKDQPLLPEKEVTFVGQPVAIVVAQNSKIAAHAVKLIKVAYKPLPVILSIEDAKKNNSFLSAPRMIARGDVSTGFKQADFIIENKITTGTQEHVYLETQRCQAFPDDDGGIILYSATQSTHATQEVAAQVLGLKNNDITLDVKRLGGAFGGKEGNSATIIAALAALACFVTKQPVTLVLSRPEDMAWSGKRHPFLGEYKIGFTKTGKILSYEVKLYANAGAHTDLSMAILERGMLHADNAYFIPNIKILGFACKTNLPPNTAFRGFGAPQGIFVIEHAITQIAHKLNMDATIVREINLYKKGDTAPYGQKIYEPCSKELFKKLKAKTHYQKLLQQTQNFNQKNKFIKRGISIVPVKFGISFTASFLNQGSSLIWIYTDGSISLSHGGVEMGQGLNTKVAKVVAHELGLSLDKIRVESSNTKRIGNSPPTAASTGSDINGHAARIAAQSLKKRLKIAAKKLIQHEFKLKVNTNQIIFADNKIKINNKPNLQLSFAELAHFAFLHQIDLGEHGFYKTPGLHFDRATGQGTPFHYYVYGVCLAQVEVNTLTGEHKLLTIHIVHETAKSLDENIDRGQISGAFMQSYGWCTMEEMNFDENGKYLAITPSTYKIPTIRDLPKNFTIDMINTKRSHVSILGSKAIGEPPLIYGEAVYFAMQDALFSLPNKNLKLTMPATPEAVLKAINNE